MTSAGPVRQNLDGTWSVLSIWSCPDCLTREWLYTPAGESGLYDVTCNGCKRKLGIAGPQDLKQLGPNGARNLIDPPKAETED